MYDFRKVFTNKNLKTTVCICTVLTSLPIDPIAPEIEKIRKQKQSK